MKKLCLAVSLLLVPALAHAWPWSMDMANQISVKPQESVERNGPKYAEKGEQFSLAHL